MDLLVWFVLPLTAETTSDRSGKRFGMSSNPELLLLANDLYHPLGHRIIELLPFLDDRLEIEKVSLVPPGLSSEGAQAPPGSFLRGWVREAVRLRAPTVWNISGIFNGLMAFPNLVALIGLSGVVVGMTKKYMDEKKRGLHLPYKELLKRKQQN